MSPPLPLDRVFQLILDLPSRRPAPCLPGCLAGLFRELAQDETGRPAEIWLSRYEMDL